MPTELSLLASYLWDKVPDTQNWKGQAFILAHNFRSFGPWSLAAQRPKNDSKRTWWKAKLLYY